LRAIAAAVLAAAAVAPPGAAQELGPLPGGWRPGPERYGMSDERVRVRMSDGIEIAATITRPTDRETGRPAPGPFPVVLALTPYGKETPGTTGNDFGTREGLVPHGYVYVLADIRGTGASGGSFELFGPREVRDSVELIGWVSRLEGTTGAVGMAGASNLGIVQLFAAAAVGRGSPLKAIFPTYVASDLYRDIVVPGGMFNSLFDGPYAALELALFTLGPLQSGQDPSGTAQDLGQHWTGSADVHGRTLTDAFNGGDRAYDGTFWRERAIERALARIPRNGVAVFAHQTWFDIFQRGASRVYPLLQQAAARQRGRRARRRGPDPRFQSIVGPWTHLFGSQRWHELELQWFETWLKGERTGIERTRTPLRLYEVGGERWVETTAWPPPAARARQWFLAGGRTGTAPNALNDGALADEPPASAGEDEIPYYQGANVPCSRMTDQEALGGPVKAQGDMRGVRHENACTHDDRGFETGALTYTTPPLERPLTIAGPGNVTLHATSTTVNSAWVVTLSDVAPGGTARPLSTGDLIGSQRALDERRSVRLGGRLLAPYHPHTRASEEPVPPGRRVRYDVELPGIMARIAPGHRIRLTVHTSYRPYLEPTLPHQEQLFGGRQRVARGGAEASSLTLAVAAPDRLRTSTVGWGPCVTDCAPAGE
jgi:uncharacterized protein